MQEVIISNDIKYVGVNDHSVDLFEGLYDVPDGMAYNSYVILDEKIAVMDTVDAHFGEQWLANLSSVLKGRTPNYLIVQHMEPDHSANIFNLLKVYPDVTVVATKNAFVMMKNFFGSDCPNAMVVGEGDTLPLGKHTLQFVTAPMVHWPEVMMTYDLASQVLFSADAFGKFGALDVEQEWRCEARRYYFGIVGKYGVQVMNVLKKASGLQISTICPLHGPVLNKDVASYLELYQTWASYQPESKGVVIAYTSVYGHTKAAAELLAAEVEKLGTKAVLTDLARSDEYENVEDAFRYDTLVLASTTYNMQVFPIMREFLLHLTDRNYQNRRIAIIENGTWSPNAAKVMTDILASCKNLTMVGKITIYSAMTEENRAQIAALAQELCK